MKKIPVRRIFDFTADDFTKRLKSGVTLIYDDGVELHHSAHELVINRHLYSLLQLVPDIGVMSRYSIHNYYVGGEYVASSINKAFETILEDVIIVYVPKTGGRKCLEVVYEKMYLILEDIYNYVVYDNLEYVASLNITDFLDIQMKPELLEAIDAVRRNKDLDDGSERGYLARQAQAVENTYVVLDRIIRESDDLKDNPIARGYISGMISNNQVKQLLASRGFVTEIDSTIFKYPIASSFVLGMGDMYDMAVESRSGAKALYLSNRAISMSEYFAREMQLTTMGVEKLVDADCGNKSTLEWAVTDKDFNNLLGKHYFVDGVEQVITANSHGIVGTTISIRNLIRCKLLNKRHVCTACLGGISNNIPLHANLGHIMLTVLSAIISQLILSTKHVTTSASSDTIVLSGAMREFFVVKNKDTYAFRANTITKKKYRYRLHIPQNQGFGIADIDKSDNVNKLNLGRVSKLDVIVLSVEDSNGNIVEHMMQVKQGTRYGNLTYKFLAHIKKYGCSLDYNDRFVIDLDGWEVGVPIISLPQVEFSYIDLAKAIKEEFKSMKETSDTPEAFLHRIFDLVNSKLKINLALLEVIVYSFIVSDPSIGNYDMGRGSTDAAQTKMLNIMTNRSVGGAYAWENAMITLLSPNLFYGNNNVDHPLDVLLKPNETLMDYNGKL